MSGMANGLVVSHATQSSGQRIGVTQFRGLYISLGLGSWSNWRVIGVNPDVSARSTENGDVL